MVVVAVAALARMPPVVMVVVVMTMLTCRGSQCVRFFFQGWQSWGIHSLCQRFVKRFFPRTLWRRSSARNEVLRTGHSSCKLGVSPRVLAHQLLICELVSVLS